MLAKHLATTNHGLVLIPKIRDQPDDHEEDWERRFIVAQAARWDINGAKNLFLRNFQALALEFAPAVWRRIVARRQRCLCWISTTSKFKSFRRLGSTVLAFIMGLNNGYSKANQSGC